MTSRHPKLQRIHDVRDECAAQDASYGIGTIATPSLEYWLNRPAPVRPYDPEYTYLQWILDGEIDRVVRCAETHFGAVADEF